MTSGRAILNVVAVGPHTSIQDSGRFGMLRYGVPASGPMDRKSFSVANAALGNSKDTPAIEISSSGLTLDCIEGSVTFAIAGGGFHIAINDVALSPWCKATLTAGSRLTIRSGTWGNWTYLAFAGDLLCSRWLGSASTHSLSGLGGGKLDVGNAITIINSRTIELANHIIAHPPTSDLRSHVRVSLGPQDRYFDASTIQAFMTQPFELTNAYDRMGVRLRGPALAVNAALDMPSEPVVRGSIQIAGDGVATVLLADHQTTGGYPKIATIITSDIDNFVQIRLGHEVRFTTINAQKSIEAYRYFRLNFDQYLQNLA